MAFYLAGEKTQVKESIPWVRCASGNVFSTLRPKEAIVRASILEGRHEKETTGEGSKDSWSIVITKECFRTLS